MTTVPTYSFFNFVHPELPNPDPICLPSMTTVPLSTVGFYTFKDLYGSSVNYPVTVSNAPGDQQIPLLQASPILQNSKGFMNIAMTPEATFGTVLETTSPLTFTANRLYANTVYTQDSVLTNIRASTFTVSQYITPALYSISSVLQTSYVSTLNLSNVKDDTVSSIFYSTGYLWYGDKVISPEVKINLVPQTISAVSTPWTPANIPNLQTWFDAQDASTMFMDTGLTSNVELASNVSVWLDKSSNAYSCIQTTYETGPQYLGGSGLFNQNTRWMQTDFKTFSTMTWVFVAMNQALTVAGALNFFIPQNEPGGWRWFLGGYTNSPYMAITNGYQTVAIDYPAIGIPPRFECYTLFTSQDQQVYRRNSLNVNLLVNANPYTDNYSTIAYFGSYPTGGPFTLIGDWVVYDRWLEETEVLQLESYMMWKYGIQSDIPSYNPFANSRP